MFVKNETKIQPTLRTGHVTDELAIAALTIPIAYRICDGLLEALEAPPDPNRERSAGHESVRVVGGCFGHRGGPRVRPAEGTLCAARIAARRRVHAAAHCVRVTASGSRAREPRSWLARRLGSTRLSSHSRAPSAEDGTCPRACSMAPTFPTQASGVITPGTQAVSATTRTRPGRWASRCPTSSAPSSLSEHGATRRTQAG